MCCSSLLAGEIAGKIARKTDIVMMPGAAKAPEKVLRSYRALPSGVTPGGAEAGTGAERGVSTGSLFLILPAIHHPMRLAI